MRDIKFTPKAQAQLEFWKTGNKKMYSRIEHLVDDIQNTPYEGIGKPEPLKYELKGCWSRRINQEHRLVYRVTTDAIIVVACKYHY